MGHAPRGRREAGTYAPRGRIEAGMYAPRGRIEADVRARQRARSCPVEGWTVWHSPRSQPPLVWKASCTSCLCHARGTRLRVSRSELNLTRARRVNRLNGSEPSTVLTVTYLSSVVCPPDGAAAAGGGRSWGVSVWRRHLFQPELETRFLNVQNRKCGTAAPTLSERK